MKGRMDTELGHVSVDADVIATYAGSVACECFGIVGMASLSVKDGLAKLLKGDNVSRGVSVKIDDEGLDINFHIIIAYGVNIRTVVENLISTVKYQIEDYTSMKVNKINVYVEGVRVID